jgi:polyisoprenoid-binding protein YceI
MKINYLLCVGFLASVVSQSVIAAPQTYEFTGHANKNQIQFISKSVVEDFEGTASQFHGNLTLDSSKPGLALRGIISVAVDSMQTGISLRDTHLRSRDWMDSSRYPALRFEIDPAARNKAVQKSPNEWSTVIEGTLTIKGRSKKIQVPVSLKLAGEELTVKGAFSVPLEDFGIHGPSAMKIIGVKVSPNVQVVLKLVGQREKPWSGTQGR